MTEDATVHVKFRTGKSDAQLQLEGEFFEIKQHPHVVDMGNDPILRPAVKIKGDMTLSKVLQHGDRVTISVANADGEIVASGEAECSLPAFKPITFEGEPIGVERITTAAIE